MSLVTLLILMSMHAATTVIGFNNKYEESKLEDVLDYIGEVSIIAHIFFMIGTMLFDLKKWSFIIVTAE